MADQWPRSGLVAVAMSHRTPPGNDGSIGHVAEQHVPGPAAPDQCLVLDPAWSVRRGSGCAVPPSRRSDGRPGHDARVTGAVRRGRCPVSGGDPSVARRRAGRTRCASGPRDSARVKANVGASPDRRVLDGCSRPWPSARPAGTVVGVDGTAGTLGRRSRAPPGTRGHDRIAPMADPRLPLRHPGGPLPRRAGRCARRARPVGHGHGPAGRGGRAGVPSG